MAEAQDTAPQPTQPSAGRKTPSATLPDGHLSSVKQMQVGLGFAEYMHYASITRVREKAANEEYLRGRGPRTLLGRLEDTLEAGRAGSQAVQEIVDLPHASSEGSTPGQKDQPVVVESSPVGPASSATSPGESQGITASRALRTAGWGSVFYLITLDIMGPSNTPFVPEPRSALFSLECMVRV